jgi:hypothetical protein
MVEFVFLNLRKNVLLILTRFSLVEDNLFSSLSSYL